VTTLGHDRRIVDRFAKESKAFSLIRTAQTASGAHPASYAMGTGGSFPRLKRQGCEAAQSSTAHLHTNIRGHQHTSTPAHQHISSPTQTYQHSNTRAHQHINTPAYHHTNTPAHQHAKKPAQHTNTPAHHTHTSTPHIPAHLLPPPYVSMACTETILPKLNSKSYQDVLWQLAAGSTKRYQASCKLSSQCTMC